MRRVLSSQMGKRKQAERVRISDENTGRSLRVIKVLDVVDKPDVLS